MTSHPEHESHSRNFRSSEMPTIRSVEDVEYKRRLSYINLQ